MTRKSIQILVLVVFENNQWSIIRHLNGDQTHQGRHVRIFHGEYAIQRLELYNYE